MDDIDLSGLSSGESVKLLKKAIEVLESIDTSIDFLAAAMTGMEPLDIELGQKALGRLVQPTSVKGRRHEEPERQTPEPIQVSEALIEEIIEEEVIEALKRKNK